MYNLNSDSNLECEYILPLWPRLWLPGDIFLGIHRFTRFSSFVLETPFSGDTVGVFVVGGGSSSEKLPSSFTETEISLLVSICSHYNLPSM